MLKFVILGRAIVVPFFIIPAFFFLLIDFKALF